MRFLKIFQVLGSFLSRKETRLPMAGGLVKVHRDVVEFGGFGEILFAKSYIKLLWIDPNTLSTNPYVPS